MLHFVFSYGAVTQCAAGSVGSVRVLNSLHAESSGWRPSPGCALVCGAECAGGTARLSRSSLAPQLVGNLQAFCLFVKHHKEKQLSAFCSDLSSVKTSYRTQAPCKAWLCCLAALEVAEWLWSGRADSGKTLSALLHSLQLEKPFNFWDAAHVLVSVSGKWKSDGAQGAELSNIRDGQVSYPFASVHSVGKRWSSVVKWHKAIIYICDLWAIQKSTSLKKIKKRSLESLCNSEHGAFSVFGCAHITLSCTFQKIHWGFFFFSF